MTRTCKQLVFTWLMAVVAFGICCTSCVFGQAPTPAMAWEKSFGDEANWYESTAVAASPRGELLIAVRVHAAFNDRYSNPRIWTFNQNGERTAETEVRSFGVDRNEIKAEHLTVFGLSIMEDGNLAVVLGDGLTRPFLLKMTTAGQILFAKVIEVKGSGLNLRVSKVVWAGDHLFLVGHNSFDAYVARIEMSGALAWEKTIDRGRMELFADGIATDDGGIILAGNMGQYDVLRVGPSEVWLSHFSGTGVEIRQPGFIGRYGSFTRTADGNYSFVYDKSNTASQDIWLKVLTPDLRQVSTSRIVSTKLGFTHFKIISLPGGGCLVQGEDDDRLYVAKLDSASNVIGSFTQPGGTSAVRFDLLQAGDNVLVVSSPFLEDQQHKSTQKVDIAKVAIK
jgi:hypothetical protein